jgi:hypothetical protein
MSEGGVNIFNIEGNEIKLSGSGAESFRRELDEVRLAVLGILVGIGLSVGFGVSAAWPIALACGFGSFVGACLLIRWKPSQNRLMRFMFWLTGR